MIIGVLSDTHGRFAIAKAAVAALTGAGAEFLIHCGDVGADAVLDALAGVPSAFVLGNTDFDHAALTRYAGTVGVQCLGAFGTLELDGKQIAVMHGDDFRLRADVIEGQRHDYLLVGHTHVPDDRRVGRTRIINPGALHRAKQWTVAVLDLRADAMTVLPVNV